MASVLPMYVHAMGLSKNFVKYSSPTHVPLVMDRVILKSRKAICTPYMGAYLKRMSIARGMRINRYSCQLRITSNQARWTRDFLLKTGMECMFFRLFSSNIGGRQPCLHFALDQGSRRLPSVQVPGKPLAALRSICLYAACQHAQRNASLRARQEPKFTS